MTRNSKTITSKALQINDTDCRIVRFDWAIKNLLRNKANFDILEGFLSELLGQQIKVQSLLESESNQETEKDKFNRVDVLVETSNNEKILIEVQAATEWDYYHRMLFGTSKLVTEYIEKGEPYHKISKVISVNILFFNLGIGKDYIYKGSTEFRGVHTGTLLKFTKSSRELYLDLKKEYDSPTDIFPTYYVIQLKKFSDIVIDKFDQWVYLLKNEVIKSEFDAQGVSSAKAKLDVLKLSYTERRKYDADMDQRSFEASLVDSHLIDLKIAKREAREEGIQEGRQEGIEEGRQEGRQKGIEEGRQKGIEEGRQEGLKEGIYKKACETALALLKNNVSIDIIILASGLTLEEINQLKR